MKTNILQYRNRTLQYPSQITMKKIALLLIICLAFSIAKSQTYPKKNFVIMSSYGYSYSEFMNGFGMINSFIYMPNKLWGYGIDLGLSSGNMKEGPYGGNHIKSDIHVNNYFIGPSIYLMPLNTTNHLIFIGTTINFSHDSHIQLLSETIDNTPETYWLKSNDNGIGFAANAGYNFRINKIWSIGARAYFNHFNESYIMGLVNIGITIPQATNLKK